MDKGEQTKTKILECAMRFVCQNGLFTISIGEMAKRMNMSRTGVISHFKDKQDMQIAILRHCEEIFIRQVLKPSFNPHPKKHLVNFTQNWVNWVYKITDKKNMTCPFVKAVAEFQDRPECLVKAVIREQQQRTLDFLESIIQRGINQNVIYSEANPSRIANDIFGFYLGHNIGKHLLNDQQADRRFEQQINELVESIAPLEELNHG
jgi:AcrR family transcriptional regulator